MNEGVYEAYFAGLDGPESDFLLIVQDSNEIKIYRQSEKALGTRVYDFDTKPAYQISKNLSEAIEKHLLKGTVYDSLKYVSGLKLLNSEYLEQIGVAVTQ